jgi:hypothetical protein
MLSYNAQMETAMLSAKIVITNVSPMETLNEPDVKSVFNANFFGKQVWQKA